MISRVVRFFILCLIYSCNVGCAQQANVRDLLPSTTRMAVVIEKMNGKTPLTINSEELFPPASTVKLITAVAAKLELGDNFKFTTTLKQAGNDVVIGFSGDPRLTSDDLKTLLRHLVNSHHTHIQGDLWLDNSMFSGYERAIGWPWDILGVCYSAPSSAITLDRNCVQGSIYTKKNGRTRIFVPESYPITVATLAKTVTEQEQKQQLCTLELHSNTDNHYQLSGCLVQQSKPLPLKFALQDTKLYTQRIVYRLLNQLNIQLDGNVKIGTPPHRQMQLIAEHHSQPLSELIEVMLKQSDNLIANNLTKTLGHHFFIQPGSFANGIEAIKQILYSKAGIDLNTAQLVDGSGLSRNNRITASQMMSVLKYIWKQEKTLHLIESMPVAGRSGTLRYRASMRSTDIKGRLIAKSGSLYGSHNMAGFGLDKSGTPKTIFVQFVTDYFPGEDKKSLPLRPLTHFEKVLYRDIVNESR